MAFWANFPLNSNFLDPLLFFIIPNPKLTIPIGMNFHDVSREAPTKSLQREPNERKKQPIYEIN
jgi:hypothetical protein